MPNRLWSIALEGAQYGSTLFTDRTGRIVVSTTRRAESSRPGGMNHSTVVVVEPRPATTYVNSHALRCYVIAADGRVDWTADEVNARCEAPDGRLVATNDRHEFLVLDRGGAQVENRAVGDGWRVIGWNGQAPIFGSTATAVWVAPHAYSLHDRQGAPNG